MAKKSAAATSKRATKKKGLKAAIAQARGSHIATPSKAMMADLKKVLAKHKWNGSPAVVQPLVAAPTAAISCPPGQCPSTVSIPGRNGTTVTIPICIPC